MGTRRQVEHEGDAEGEPLGSAGAASVSAEPVDFDAQLARLEAIVVELDSGRLGLDATIARYSDGIALLKGCHEVLTTHRRRVEELTRDAERTLVAFDEDPDHSTDASARPRER